MNPAYESEKINPADLPPGLPDENGASAPMPDDLPSYTDYMGMNSGPSAPLHLPPPLPPAYDVAVNDAKQWEASGMISKEEALSALREHAKKLFCWGEGPIDKMDVKTLEPSTAYKYLIDTWTENRETSWKHEPYHGGPVDGEFNGQPPAPWDIPVTIPAPFTEQVYHIRVPHTENVRMCTRCHGRGRTRCHSCSGQGHKDCHSCRGGERSDGSRCTFCHGSGRRRCGICHGNGYVRCSRCHGAGQLKHFIELKVTFHTHDDDYVYETTDLPDKLILKAKGTNMFEETADRIGPILNYYITEINDNSAKLVEKHATKWPMERIWKQRHQLDSVPVYEMRYDIQGDDEGRFWVYGEDKKAYSSDYPAQCCCCCNIPGLCNNCSCCNKCTIL